MARPIISHPYPPSYRSSPGPSTDDIPLQAQPQLQSHDGEKQSRRWRSAQRLLLKKSNRPKSPTDPTVPLTAGLNQEDKEGRGAGSIVHGEHGEQRKDENGLLLPEGWSQADEEAEREFLRQGMFDWKALMGWRYWIRKEWWGKSNL